MQDGVPDGLSDGVGLFVHSTVICTGIGCLCSWNDRASLRDVVRVILCFVFTRAHCLRG